MKHKPNLKGLGALTNVHFKEILTLSLNRHHRWRGFLTSLLSILKILIQTLFVT